MSDIRIEDLLLPLADPSLAFSLDPVDPATQTEAVELYRSGDLSELAQLYQRLSGRAWQERAYRLGLRLLIAERSVARLLGDRQREDEATRYLAARNRLRERFLVAEAWNRRLLEPVTTSERAVAVASVWRELAAIREVAAQYDEGLRYCANAVAVCDEHAGVPGIPSALVKALLQKAVLHRLQGDLEATRTTLDTAQEIADNSPVEPLVHGLVALRQGGLEIVVGRLEIALGFYRRAEEASVGVSENNRFIARVRQIRCLSGLRRSLEALALAERLVVEYPVDREPYRHGQVLIELAEVQEDLDRLEDVAATLRRAAPLFEGKTSLESLRWRTHLARSTIDLGKPPALAADLLAEVLTIAAEPERMDVTRTMLALHQVARLSASRLVGVRLGKTAARAALVAADLQRDSLQESGVRFSLHGIREAIYSAAVVAHAEVDHADAVAQIIELGRADLVNRVLSGSTARPPADSTEDSLRVLFETARTVASQLTSDSLAGSEVPLLPLPGSEVKPELLDQLADVVVVAQIWSGERDKWWCTTAARPRGGAWRLTSREAGPVVNRLLPKLLADDPIARSIRPQDWEELGAFLLPDPDVWSGTVDHPLSVAICPDPRLWQLPYAALRRGQTHLVDVAEISLAPSLHTRRLLYERRNDIRAGDQSPALSLLDETLPGHHDEAAALDEWPFGHHRIVGLDDLPEASLLYISGIADRPGAEASLEPAT